MVKHNGRIHSFNGIHLVSVSRHTSRNKDEQLGTQEHSTPEHGHNRRRNVHSRHRLQQHHMHNGLHPPRHRKCHTAGFAQPASQQCCNRPETPHQQSYSRTGRQGNIIIGRPAYSAHRRKRFRPRRHTTVVLLLPYTWSHNADFRHLAHAHTYRPRGENC